MTDMWIAKRCSATFLLIAAIILVSVKIYPRSTAPRDRGPVSWGQVVDREYDAAAFGVSGVAENESESESSVVTDAGPSDPFLRAFGNYLKENERAYGGQHAFSRERYRTTNPLILERLGVIDDEYLPKWRQEQKFYERRGGPKAADISWPQYIGEPPPPLRP